MNIYNPLIKVKKEKGSFSFVLFFDQKDRRVVFHPKWSKPDENRNCKIQCFSFDSVDNESKKKVVLAVNDALLKNFSNKFESKWFNFSINCELSLEDLSDLINIRVNLNL